MFKTTVSLTFLKSVRQYTHPSIDLVGLKLTTRTLLRLSGASAAEYLQGLITNDVKHLTEGQKNCIFAMFLNSKGRVLFDTIIYKEGDDAFLIESDKDLIQDVADHLKMFKVRRKLSIDLMDDSHSVLSLHSAEALVNAESNNPTKMPALPTQLGIPSYKDPRCGALGYRMILPNNKDEVLENVKIRWVPEDTYRTLRYRLGIAEGAKEIPPGKCFPLEYNCDYLHGVSFHKGCYQGQEVTARTHHTGVVRKRIMPLFFENNLGSLPMDAGVVADGKAAGKLRGFFENHAIALLRVDEVLKAAQLDVEGKICRTYRPFWWPKEAPKGRPG